VRVLYFAGLRERLGVSSEEVVLAAGVATLGGLREQLAARGGEWSAALAEARLRMAVNQDLADASAPIRAGDEVAFFPPVTGG
jgi:molybdopterin synthase sulfur carrier subunit